LPWTSTPMPISVIQRTRAIGFQSIVRVRRSYWFCLILVGPAKADQGATNLKMGTE
jgi:hypothetical protein